MVLAGLVAASRKELLHAMVEAAVKKYPALDLNRTLQLVTERELMGATAVGNGVAIPHAKLEECQKSIMVVASTRNIISFASEGRMPCRLFFLLLSPTQGRLQHLALMGEIAELFKDRKLRDRCLRAATNEDLWAMLSVV